MPSILPLVKVNDKSFLDIALEIGDNPESLSEFTQSANVQPMTLIEEEISRMDEDVRNDILQAHLTLYTSWYLMASMHRVKVDGVSVRELLNPLSTNPSVRNSLRISTESAKVPQGINKGLSLDAFSAESAKSQIDHIQRNTALMVGKIIDVPLSIANDSKSKDITVPVNVMLSPRTADIDFMVELFKHINKDQSWTGRWHQLMSGEIKSKMDYLFALDINREERRLAIKDKDGIYSEGKARRAKGILTSLLSGSKSINVASTMTIITKRSASRLEAVLDGGRLSDYRTRQRFFEDTGSMILTVVNPDRKTLTVYTRGYDKEARWSFRDIKNMGTSPGAGFDMASVISSLSRGSLPGSR